MEEGPWGGRQGSSGGNSLGWFQPCHTELRLGLVMSTLLGLVMSTSTYYRLQLSGPEGSTGPEKPLLLGALIPFCSADGEGLWGGAHLLQRFPPPPALPAPPCTQSRFEGPQWASS